MKDFEGRMNVLLTVLFIYRQAQTNILFMDILEYTS